MADKMYESISEISHVFMVAINLFSDTLIIVHRPENNVAKIKRLLLVAS